MGEAVDQLAGTVGAAAHLLDGVDLGTGREVVDDALVGAHRVRRIGGDVPGKGNGAIAQVGSPEDIYLQPRTRFVSTFIGEANVLAGRRMDGAVTLQAGLRFPSAGTDGPVRVIVRPEAIALEDMPDDAGAALTGTLQDVVFLGPYVKYKIVLGSGEDIVSHVPSLDGSSMFTVGSHLKVSWNPDTHRVLDD